MNLPRFPCMTENCEREGRVVVYGADADSARRGRCILCLAHANTFWDGGELHVVPLRMELTQDAKPGEAFVIDSPGLASAILSSVR